MRLCILRYILYQIIISKIPKFEKLQVSDIERNLSQSPPNPFPMLTCHSRERSIAADHNRNHLCAYIHRERLQ